MPGLINIKARLKIPPALEQLFRNPWKREDTQALAQIVEDEISKRSARDIFQERQKTWRPLSPKYAEWKRKRGYGEEIWFKTGNAYAAMAKTINMDSSGGTNGVRRAVVHSANERSIHIQYEVNAPAAGGYFRKNQRRRPWLSITSDGIQRIHKNALDYFVRKFRKAGFR